MSDFDPRAYWESALGKDFDLRGVSYGSLGLRYNEWLYRLRRVVFRRLLRQAGVVPRRCDMLDVGCGTGFYIELLLRAGARSVTGVDLTETSVANLRARFPAATFAQADVGDSLAVLGDRAFDVVDAFDVLFHVVDDARYAKAFHNLAGVLRPGGHLLFSDNFLHAGERRGRHHVSRSLRQTEAAVEAAGLRIEGRMPMFVLMNEPVDVQGELGRKLWSRTVPLASRSEALGYAIGAMLYPVDRLLTKVLRESPTTEIMICRKPA